MRGTKKAAQDAADILYAKIKRTFGRFRNREKYSLKLVTNSFRVFLNSFGLVVVTEN